MVDISKHVRPTPPCPDIEAIPPELRALPRWVLWEYRWNGKKWTKPPLTPTGRNASSTNPADWCDFETAWGAFEAGEADGLGFVFNGRDGYKGVDLDDAIDANGTLREDAREAVEFLDSYTELSPSGTGLHILVRSDAPLPGPGKCDQSAGREMYEAGRYFTFTGKVLGGRGTIRHVNGEVADLYLRWWPDATHTEADVEPFTGGGGGTLAELPIHDDLRRLVAEGVGMERFDDDRSRALLSVMIGMLVAGCAEDAILDVLTDPRHWLAHAALQRRNGDVASAKQWLRQHTLPKARKRARATLEDRSGLMGSGSPGAAPSNDSGHANLHNHVGADPTEDELATALVVHAPNWRYCAALGGWLRWDGQRYVRDETLQVWDETRAMLRSIAAPQAAAKPALSKRLGAKQTVVAVESLARSNRAYARAAEDFDADPWALNTPGGVVDLRTGELLPASPAHLVTRITAVTPGGECLLWLAFLHTVTRGDAALIAYLQRVAGYCLTGSTREHAFLFFYGTGGNGKGVFLNTLRAVLGSYAKAAPIETFTASSGDRHPTDLAMLRGARLVVAQETERGRRWAESRLKAITGGDPVSARYMRQDFFEYVPQFKLLLSGNHKPALSSVDEAMKRRLHLVPFTVTIPERERDPELPERLRAEWSGILRWCLDGLADYLEQGLAPPPAVLDATREYFEAEDAFGAWLAECCEQSAAHWETPTSLFRSWSDWCQRNGYQAGSQKTMAAELEKHGFEKGKTGMRGRHWNGLRLAHTDTGDAR